MRRKVAHAGNPGMIVEEGAEIEAAAGIAAAALPAVLLAPVISILIPTKVEGMVVGAAAAGATAAMKNPDVLLAHVEATRDAGPSRRRPDRDRGRAHLAVGNAAK